ncbi:MAG: T9SS type A sorting domain-containing protein, partial [Candidatus Krumholzibacteriota bacterium]|nr:T9SS type A sorting domain-containing protein [Candidatus Krumholzibacteriota bacterium]
EYCLAVGNCCLTSSYEISECFGETWLRAAGKGAIGYIGASNSTYWDEDYWWGIGAGPVSSNPTYETHGMGAYDGVFHDHGEAMDQWYVVNDALVFCGNVAVMEGGGYSTYYWNIYNLSGDPSLSTFMGVPAANPVSHAGQIIGGSTSFTVSAVPGSYVGITVDGALKGAGTVGTSGTADIALTDIGYSGTAHMVVMAQNREPYVVDLTIGSTEQPTCEIDPLSFDVTLVVGGSTTVPLTIGNEGEPGSTLYYTLAIDDPVLPDRSIAGSTFTSNPTSYTPGATATYTLTIYNASGDYEWLDEATLDFPAGVTVVSSTNFTGGSGGDLITNNATGDGARLVWSDNDGGWGEVYGGESATAQVTLTFAGGAMGDLDIPWTMSGDDYGSSPHDINGTLTITGPSGPTLQLVAPNGGEIWAVGDSHDIIFNVTQVDFVRISLSRDGGRSWETLATSAPADAGSWDWTVTGPVSASCIVRLEDTAGQADPVQSAETFYIHVPCDWLSLPWAEGECGVGEYDVIDIGFNAAGLAGGDYHARIFVSHSAPTPDVVIPVWLHVGATDVAETPAALRLEKNYPNPFNPRTTISFSLPAAAEITLAVHDVRGRQVALLASGAWSAGRHDVVWDGRDGAGHPVASGLYLYRLEADGVRITNKMLLMK